MNKRNRISLICLLWLGVVLACAQVEQFRSTPTPSPSATVPPTRTPVPSRTPLPTSTPIPGWEKFEGKGVELWLPESFEGGDLEKDFDVMIEKLNKLGPDFQQAAQTLEENRSSFALWAFDSSVGARGFLTNVSVTSEGVFSSMSVDTYLDLAMGHLPASVKVVSRDLVSVGDREAGRMDVQARISGITAEELLYVIKDGNTMWLVTFATSGAEFENRMPVFDQSAQTFAIRP